MGCVLGKVKPSYTCFCKECEVVCGLGKRLTAALDWRDLQAQRTYQEDRGLGPIATLLMPKSNSQLTPIVW